MIKVMGTLMMLGGLMLVVVLGVWSYDRYLNPQESIQPSAETNGRFPVVKGSNLSRQQFTLPGDIEGRYAILMIAFKQFQQLDVNTWLSVVQELESEYGDLVYYELPTITRLNPASRAMIDGGMRAGIPDPKARATTITLYLDKAAFMEILDISDEDSIVVMLIDREGEIYWRVNGPATEEAVNGLRAQLSILDR